MGAVVLDSMGAAVGAIAAHQQQQAANGNAYDCAFAAGIEGRGYTVR